MKAAVTEARGTMRIADVPDPGEPGSGEVLVRPEAVGLCGSDFHYFLGHLGDAVGTDLYPRVQGHEFAGVRRGRRPRLPDRPPRRRAGRRVAADGVRALLPVPDRPAERLLEHQPRRHPSRRRAPGAGPRARRPGLPGRRPRPRRVRADRARLDRGAGNRPRADRGGREGGRLRRRPDRPGRRVRRGRPWRVACCSSTASRAVSSAAGRVGADLLVLDEGADLVAAGREWAGDEGPEVVFEATGVPELVQTAVRLVSQAGRVVVVGLSAHDAPLRVGDLAFREIDVLGVSCCNGRRVRRGGVTRRPAAGRARGSRHARVPARRGTFGDRLCDPSSCRGHEGDDPPGGHVTGFRALDERGWRRSRRSAS